VLCGTDDSVSIYLINPDTSTGEYEELGCVADLTSGVRVRNSTLETTMTPVSMYTTQNTPDGILTRERRLEVTSVEKPLVWVDMKRSTPLLRDCPA